MLNRKILNNKILIRYTSSYLGSSKFKFDYSKYKKQCITCCNHTNGSCNLFVDNNDVNIPVDIVRNDEKMCGISARCYNEKIAIIYIIITGGIVGGLTATVIQCLLL